MRQCRTNTNTKTKSFGIHAKVSRKENCFGGCKASNMGNYITANTKMAIHLKCVCESVRSDESL